MSNKRPRWTIASARQHFPELINMAAREPQEVYRRDKRVATIVSPSAADELAQSQRQPSLAEELAELQRMCAEEDYTLVTGNRVERRNPMGPPVRRKKRVRR